MKTINHKHVHDTSNVSERFLKNKQLYTNYYDNKCFFNKHKALELYDAVDKDSPYHLTHAVGIIIDIKA